MSRPLRFGLILSIALIALGLRLWNLGHLPIFSDEAMYIHLAQWVHDAPAEFALTRFEGKNPLFFGLNAIAFFLFNDPLIAGRMVSVAAGMAGLAGVYCIGRFLFSSAHGLLATLLYAVCPYVLFFDRLALVDTLAGTLAVWGMYFSIKSVASADRRAPFLAGLFLALGLWTKLSLFALLPAIPILFLSYRVPFKQALVRCGAILTAALLLTSPLFLWGKTITLFMTSAPLQAPDYVLTANEILQFPWERWTFNATLAGEFFFTYLTPPVALVLAFGFLHAVVERRRETTALALWTLIPTTVFVISGKGLFSRYFLLSVPPALLLTAFAVHRLGEFANRLIANIAPRIFRIAIGLPLLTAITLTHAFFLPICSPTGLKNLPCIG
jgi:4-amino-4-deoxy-L-arabinose transferase-like glycosyltransferase